LSKKKRKETKGDELGNRESGSGVSESFTNVFTKMGKGGEKVGKGGVVPIGTNERGRKKKPHGKRWMNHSFIV